MTSNCLLGSAAMVLALSVAPAAAQAQGHGKHDPHASSSMMPHHGVPVTTEGSKIPCPLHLTTLNTTPAQDSLIAGIRRAHMADMRAMHASHGPGASGAHHADAATQAQIKAHMRAAMDSAVAEMGAVLDADQRRQLGEAVAAHAAEQAAMEKDGMTHDCSMCCKNHEQHKVVKGAVKHEH